MRFYEDMYLFGDNYQINAQNTNKSNFVPKWELHELNLFNRHSMSNINIFSYLLDAFENKKGIYSSNITFIQSQMKKYDIKPNAKFYNKLLQIANKAKQDKEIQKLCQLILKNINCNAIEACPDTLELMIQLLFDYKLIDNAQQVYDFYYRELQLIDHWMQPNSENNMKQNIKTKRRMMRNKLKIEQNNESNVGI